MYFLSLKESLLNIQITWLHFSGRLLLHGKSLLNRFVSRSAGKEDKELTTHTLRAGNLNFSKVFFYKFFA